MTARRRIRWSHAVPAALLAVAALVVCGALGLWQWNRASEQGEVRQPDPAAPIADVAAPATTLGSELGREVWADGEFAAADAALVPGREIDGEPAVMVVRPFTVDADATGTGEPATLAVIVGWVTPGEVDLVAPTPPADSTVTGHLRSAESGAPGTAPSEDPPAGTFWAPGLSPAAFAQHWDSPLYSGLLTADEPEEGLNALPEPAEDRSLDFRSLAYAVEWWLFGAFFVFIAARWIRDNGTVAPAEPVAPDQSQGGPT